MLDQRHRGPARVRLPGNRDNERHPRGQLEVGDLAPDAMLSKLVPARHTKDGSKGAPVRAAHVKSVSPEQTERTRRGRLCVEWGLGAPARTRGPPRIQWPCSCSGPSSQERRGPEMVNRPRAHSGRQHRSARDSPGYAWDPGFWGRPLRHAACAGRHVTRSCVGRAKQNPSPTPKPAPTRPSCESIKVTTE